jgi:hypothetical protein
LLAAAAGTATPRASAQTVFYSENFDGAVRDQASGDPRVLGACVGGVFTHTPPAGWTWNACGIGSYACREGCQPPPTTCSTCGNNEGVYEWEGWSFASKSWWAQVAGDQDRSQFTLASGNVAVADPDEWDDRGNPDANCGYYNAWMSTPAINITTANRSSLVLNFASSWKPEGFDDAPTFTNNQTGVIRAIYTVGGVEQPAVEVLRWDSDSSGTFYKPNATNEAVSLAQLQAPATATAVRFEIGLLNAGNDWWWAVDNVELSSNVGTLFFEDFEGVTLEPPVHEAGCGATYCNQFTYTHNGPGGVGVSVASPATGGVPDWRGWSFVERPFWVCTSGGPNGSAFSNSSGLVAVADGDEFDDLPHDAGDLDTTMSTPSISLSGRFGGVLVLSFDSSWRFEDSQAATIVARFNDSNQTVSEVLRWESAPGPFFKGDAVNERVIVPVTVPADATSVVLDFRYTGADDWWWAIDNVSLFEGRATVQVATVNPSQTSMQIAPTIDYTPCFSPWSPTAPSGWTQLFSPDGGCGAECGRPEWRGWAIGFKDWWWQKVDNQERDQFTLGTGYVAIADPDEWDDFPNNSSKFNAFMTTPSIALPASVTSASFTFDSSWRYEGFDDGCSCDPPGSLPSNNQTATVNAIYTVGGQERPPVPILHWDSDDGQNSGSGQPSPFFKPDNTNEAVTITALGIPANAQSVRFEFGLTEARNDWWWAVDNINFTANGVSRFSENFESNDNFQGPPSEEPPTEQCQYFSSVALQGNGFAVVNDATLSGCSTTEDFRGFNAWLLDAWSRARGGALRAQLVHDRTNGVGPDSPTGYVSDFTAGPCDGTTTLSSPSYSIAGLNEGSLVLSFRSGWASEAGHVSSVEVQYNGGAWTPVLSWTTGNKSSTADETVNVQLNNAAGASTVAVRFIDSSSGWWVISDIGITGDVGGCPADFNGDNQADFFDYLDFALAFDGEAPEADFNRDGQIDFFDYLDFIAAFDAGC